MISRAVIIGTGSALPKRVLSNVDLEKMVDTSDEWITSRTGIKERRIAGKGEETSKLAAAAANKALEMAGLAADEIDLIVVATITAEMGMPSCACLVQKEIGAYNAFAYDLNAACSGFLYGLDLADKYIRCTPDMKILVIGAENLSTRVNWKDRNTCILFGDGAGACVVTGNDQGRGLIASKLFSDGRLANLLYMDSIPSMNPDLQRDDYEGPYIRMVGPEVFKNAIRAMEDSVKKILDSEGISTDDVDIVIPHQANMRILKGLSDRMGISSEKFYINVYKYGNTSAASVAIAIDEANREGRLKQGDLLLLCVFGSGFTWGSSIIKW
ncbi:MAG: ketoacyl-ACP synthase III [Proteobacteria bacterium]|nr:ketoacyl-ACP synthase III [Pseudomonadota bacterium]MBU1710122.1 ketoacyl-ACP synthase III [Pseudomonadota bacterium]